MTRRRAIVPSAARGRVRCAIYTRKSSDEGLQQEFNSLDAQREAAEAYVATQTERLAVERQGVERG
ncbi:MAG TPA: resolvase, partial [Phycisphaerae bacterium]|nr:resolvase [Phycisphaerae bacterium]